jgi:hypothetical protein
MKFILPLAKAGALLAVLSLGLSAPAATPVSASDENVRISDDWQAAGAPGTSRPRAPAGLDAAITPPRDGLLKDLTPNAARDWKSQMTTREGAEDYSCVLSFGIGGTLRSSGYLGARGLGQTLNLSRPGAK